MPNRKLTLTRPEGNDEIPETDTADPQLDVWLHIMGIPKGAHVFNPDSNILTWAEEPNRNLDLFITNKQTRKPPVPSTPEEPLEKQRMDGEETVIHRSTTAHKDTPDTLTLLTVEDLRSALNMKVRQRVTTIRSDRADRAAQQRRAEQTRKDLHVKKRPAKND